MPQTKLSRRKLFKLFTSSLLIGCTGTLGTYSYAAYLEPGWLEISRHELKLPRLHSAFDGFTVAHLSDFHIGNPFIPVSWFQELVNATNALKPDLIVISGDVLDSYSTHTLRKELAKVLGQLQAPAGVFAVLGNHDYWHNPDESRLLLRQSQITELPNAAHTLTKGAGTLHIAGIDDIFPDPSYLLTKAEQRGYLEQAISAMPAEGAAILLAHEPDIADLTAEYERFDLQLSGHSHGGQVRVPIRGALVLPPMGIRYPIGRYQVGSLIHYTSRGVGVTGFRVRLLCRPEIALLTLRASQG